MSVDETHVICDRASLELWKRRLRSTLWARNLPAVEIRLRECMPGENQTLSVLANNLQQACGCASSGFFMSAAVVTMTVSYFTSEHRLSNIGLSHFLSFVGIAVLASLTGKLLGLCWARWRLLRFAARLRKTIAKEAQRGIVAESL